MIQVTDNILSIVDDETMTSDDFRLLFRLVLGRNVGPIPDRLRYVANMLRYDQARLEQNAELKREKNRERQRRFKEKQNADNADNADNAPFHPSHTIHPAKPTTHHTESPGSSAGSVGVSLDKVLSAARKSAIPEDFAREFHEDMSNGDWAYVNRQGNTAKVTPENFASVLNARWKSRKDTYTPPPEPPRPKHYTAKDWNLCAERCRNFDARRGCKCGIKVPPDKYQDHPHPPQECPMFAEVKA